MRKFCFAARTCRNNCTDATINLHPIPSPSMPSCTIQSSQIDYLPFLSPFSSALPFAMLLSGLGTIILGHSTLLFQSLPETVSLARLFLNSTAIFFFYPVSVTQPLTLSPFLSLSNTYCTYILQARAGLSLCSNIFLIRLMLVQQYQGGGEGDDGFCVGGCLWKNFRISFWIL